MTESFKPKKKDNLFGLSVFWQISLVLFSAIFLAISAYAFVFFAFAMLPTIVTLTIDRRPTKYASSTVGGFNFIASLPFVIQIVSNQDSNAKAQILMTDVNSWFYIYGVASIGWILIWSIPQLVSMYYTFRMKSRVERLKIEQEKLLSTWGENLKMY